VLDCFMTVVDVGVGSHNKQRSSPSLSSVDVSGVKL
jgi:hypothetical protein